MLSVLMAFGIQLWNECAYKLIFVLKVLRAELAATSTFNMLGTFF